MTFLKKNLTHKTKSLILFVFLFVLDTLLRELEGEYLHQYFSLVYVLVFFYYYRFGSEQGDKLLNISLLFQFIGNFLSSSLTLNVWVFSIMMIVLNLNLVLFSYLIFKRAKIKKVLFYLIGIVLIIPYGIVMNFQLFESFGALFWWIQLRVVVVALLVSISVAHFAKFPTVKGSYAMIGSLMIFINNLFYGYNLLFFEKFYFKYGMTLTYLVGYFFILTFLIEPHNKKEEGVLNERV
jgi:hypothetical protein